MALYSILRRGSSSVVPLAIRTVRSSTTLRDSICTARSVEKGKLFLDLSRRSCVPSLHFCTATAEKQSSGDSLIQIIDSEIKCAEELVVHDCVEFGSSEVTLEVVEIPDGFPFEIQDNPGERIVVVKREYQDEIIKVEVDIPKIGSEQDVDGEDSNDDSVDENKIQPRIPLVVSVSRNGLCLQFGVWAFPDVISIHSLSIKKQQSSEDKLAYEGPEFSDLDENLQKALHKYLEIRGLNPTTANFLLEYMISKDSREYLFWLKNLKKFVEK